MTDTTAILDRIRASFDADTRDEFEDSGDPLQLILHEEGREALIQTVIDAEWADVHEDDTDVKNGRIIFAGKSHSASKHRHVGDTDLDALLTRADKATSEKPYSDFGPLIADLAAAVRHLHTENETARAVLRRLLTNWELDMDLGLWWPPEGLDTADGLGIKKPVSEEERALLASIQGADDA